MAGILDLLSQTWPARLAQDAYTFVTAPRDAYQGKLDPLSPEGIARINGLAGLMVGTPGTPGGALGTSLNGSRVGTMAGSSLKRAANLNDAAAAPMGLPGPLSLSERTWQNYASKLRDPEEVLQLDALWSPRDGVNPAEHFAGLANDMWQRMGANRYMTPEMADRYMRIERGKLAGIQPVE